MAQCSLRLQISICQHKCSFPLHYKSLSKWLRGCQCEDLQLHPVLPLAIKNTTFFTNNSYIQTYIANLCPKWADFWIYIRKTTTLKQKWFPLGVKCQHMNPAYRFIQRSYGQIYLSVGMDSNWSNGTGIFLIWCPISQSTLTEITGELETPSLACYSMFQYDILSLLSRLSTYV